MRISSAIGTNNSTLTSILAAINGTARPAGALPIALSFDGRFVPHALTLQATYTVPANKNAIVSGLSGNLIRTTAPSTNGVMQIFFRITPDGAASIGVVSFKFPLLVVETITNFSMACKYDLGPGDVIEILTSDTSLGGIVGYAGSATIQEIDVV